ncbi:MAG: 30S ribosomal protein S6 [Proteobacteria bacterium]|nr:30S ribosomal protein S6 [Pseudomonadota bacterium]
MNLYLYECVFIVRQDLPVQDVNKLTERFSGLVNQGGGKVIKKEYWGLRNLAYVIQKNKKGHYVMLGVQAGREAMSELERNMMISEDVINQRVFRVNALDDTPSIMMREPADSSALEAEQ